MSKVIMVLGSIFCLSLHGQSNDFWPGDRQWFDSLNVRFVGNWPFGPSEAVAYDLIRNLVFCGSGGGVYVLDVSNPATPQKISERIHSQG